MDNGINEQVLKQFLSALQAEIVANNKKIQSLNDQIKYIETLIKKSV